MNIPQNPNGQATMANSQPLVISSDQSKIPILNGGSTFLFSSLNSTTANLASSATFTGTIESITSYPAISVLVFSDQPGTLTINQYADAAGLQLVNQQVFSYIASAKFSRSFIINGNYLKTTYQNTGGSTTTSLNIDIAYGVIDAATLLNNGPVSINEVNGTVLSLGQTTMTNSLPIVIASNQSAIPISNSGIPTSLGQQAASTSQPVALANEDVQDLYFTGQATQTATVNNIIPGTVSSSATDLTGYRSGSIQIICPAGTYTTGAIIFEGTNDTPTSTNFQTLVVYNQVVIAGNTIVAPITLVSGTSIIYTFPITTRYVRVRISTAVSGAGASVQAFSKFSQTTWTPPVFQVAQANLANFNTTSTIASGTITTVTTLTGTTTLTPGTGATNLGKAKGNTTGSTDTGVGLLVERTDAPIVQNSTAQYIRLQADSVGALQVHQIEKSLKTYSASTNFAPTSITATDIFTITGSASTTVYITKVFISGTQATYGLVDISLIKRSTADTGGTSTAVTAVPHDSNNAAASATILSYTANPTVGTPVGSVRRGYTPVTALTTAVNPTVIFDFGDKGQPMILRGTAQVLAVSLNGASMTTPSFSISIEWYEI